MKDLEKDKLIKTEFHLVTTADERTWNSDIPILFLGEWCKVFSRLGIWSKLNGITAEPIIIDKVAVCTTVQKIKDKLLDELTLKLNELHHVNFNKRCWDIILGHWLLRYVSILYNRYHNIEFVFEKYNIVSTDELNLKSLDLYSLNSVDLVWNSDEVIWNHILYIKIIKYLNPKGLNINLISKEKSIELLKSKKGISTKNIKEKMLIFLGNFLSKFNKKRDGFIINSYLPRIKEFQLYLSLMQVPQVWKSPTVEYPDFDKSFRSKLLLDSNNHIGFELFVRQMINQILPIAYLEGFSLLVNTCENLNWPTEPRFIFTSNNFDSDDVFKVWTALKIMKGSKYFVGQHGNNYGSHFLHGNKNAPERANADIFYSWGWSSEKSNVSAMFNFKILSKFNQSLYKKNGGLLLIESPIPHSIYPWDNYFEMNKYQDEQFNFYKSLDRKIQNSLIIRLHSESKNLKWDDVARWNHYFPTANINTGNEKIWDLIAESRLVIHSYDSTGILETLSLNIPTLCFWPDGFLHLLPEAIPYYQLLLDSGILLTDGNEIGEKINRIWENVDIWWNNPNIQNARIKFCQQYSRLEKFPVLMLSKSIKENLN